MIYDKILNRPRDSTVGYTGTLYDSLGNVVATVEDGVITAFL